MELSFGIVWLPVLWRVKVIVNDVNKKHARKHTGFYKNSADKIDGYLFIYRYHYIPGSFIKKLNLYNRITKIKCTPEGEYDPPECSNFFIS